MKEAAEVREGMKEAAEVRCACERMPMSTNKSPVLFLKRNRV
jgi:hypothetical protein